ncbi:rhodanese-like domain-containing protein [Rosistilla oblonga]|nr:rhodanese-like domain-containing protein [Rosistilla oblonga]
MAPGDIVLRLCNASFGAIEAVRRSLGRPAVETISTAELHAAMNSSQTPPVLVDVRSDAERVVSRIPGAITQQEFEASSDDKFAGRRVVTYCTVGGRSYWYARKLAARGIEAANYRDSILGWCRASLPLESPDGQATNAVHPYWRIFHVPDRYDVKT